MKDGFDNWADRWGWVACLLLALALRGLVVGLRPDELTHDRDAYLGMAQGIAQGRGLCSPGSDVPTAFRPPLYPLLLGGLMRALPSGVAVAVVNGLFGAVAVWATWRASQCLGLGRAGLLATLLVAVDPLLLKYSTQPMTETTCAGLVALLVLGLVCGREPLANARVPLAWGFARQCGSSPASPVAAPLTAQSDRQWHPIVGVWFGLLVLCRPTFWPLAGLMALPWLVDRSRDWYALVLARVPLATSFVRQSASAPQASTLVASASLAAQSSRQCHPAVPCDTRRDARHGSSWRVVIAALIVVAPWVIRNQLVLGVPLLTTTHGGYTLLLANNPVFWDEVVDQPWGTVWQGESLARWQRGLEERLARELGSQATEPEPECDARLNRLGREYIAAQPRRFARAAWHRVRSLWSTVPLGDAGADAPRWVIEAVGWYYSALLLAFVVGMAVVVRRAERGRWWPLFALVLTVQAVHLVYWTNARMRAPLTPVIALFAAALLAPRGRSKSDSLLATASGLAEQGDSSLRSVELT